MSKTVRYRNQHKEILETVQMILKSIEGEDFIANSDEIRSLLAKLAGKINVHLTMEDEGLYPRLLNHAEAEIRTMAASYAQEMSGIKEQFTAYIKKWPHHYSIIKQPELFREETVKIFSALKNRISKEDNELYYIYDRLA